jgi:hypothetical protein
MSKVTSITKEAFLNVSKDEDGTYRLYADGDHQEHTDIQSVWAALDEIDAPRRGDALADAA